MPHPQDLIEFTAEAIRIFGPGTHWECLRLHSVPGYQLGESLEEEVRRHGWTLSPWDPADPLWGPPTESKRAEESRRKVRDAAPTWSAYR